jgi:hypothetical protein
MIDMINPRVDEDILSIEVRMCNNAAIPGVLRKVDKSTNKAACAIIIS